MAIFSYQTFQSKSPNTSHSISVMLKGWCLTLFSRLLRTIKTCYLMEIIQYLYFNMFRSNHKTEWKTHWQSPNCQHILQRKTLMNNSKSSLTWASLSFILTSLIYLDLRSNFSSNIFGIYSTIIWFTEVIICFVVAFNGMAASYFYLKSMMSKPVAISPIQKKLFRIEQNDPGFEVKQKEDSVADSKSEPLRFASFRESFDYSSPSLLSQTPSNYSINSWLSSSPSYNGLDTTSSSWSFRRLSSPLNYSTPKSAHTDQTSMRRREQTPDLDLSYERPIRNRKHLEDFLKVQEEEKQKSMSNDDSKHFLSNMTSVENSPMSVLSKCLYQRAYRSINTESTEENSSEIRCGENVLNKLKISDKMLTIWSERIRKWICQTILVKLVQEIDDINNSLVEFGLPEFQIGNVSLLALNQLAMTKAQNLPTLSAVLPYLDMHLNQKYLVERLKTLSRGGCMGSFKWNAGSSYNDKSWCDDLPTDAALIMHILCCYFDAHLPPEPHFPEGKPFSSKYFKKIPEKPVLLKDTFYIYQSSVNPPHFKFVLHENIYSLQKGRNNLFCTIAVLLHHIKTKQCGMLGRVNLGPSGVNILWVLD